ncbi:hypothetical protein D9M72_434690 [compost metagenome]
MDQVIKHVDAVQRLPEQVAVVEAALDDLHLVEPGNAGDLRRSPDHDFHGVSGLKETGDQPPADITGGTGDKHGFRDAVHVDLLGTKAECVGAQPA